jgi:hypothetical protein
MRAAALFSLLLVACSSNMGFEDERLLQCDSGQDIELRAGLQAPRGMINSMGDRVTMLLEVSNNSHQEIVVKTIRVEQERSSQTDYRVDPVTENFDRAIPENEDYTFELSMTGYGSVDRSGRRASGGALTFAATVHLANGDTYRCSFAVPSPV